MLIADRIGGTLLLTLNRPAKGNALHPELIRELGAALAKAGTDDGIRVVAITGAGKSFCAGLDLDQLMELEPDPRLDYMKSAFSLFRQVYELPQPVVAAVNGPAIAGGFDLAAFCDLRLCAPEARFGQTEILLGLTQIMYPLYTLIGLGRAKELALTGRVIEAEEAHRIGLVHRIVPNGELIDETLRLAESLARRPPEALAETKRLSRELLDLETGPAMDRMLEAILARLRSDEHRQALRSYARKLRSRDRGGKPPPPRSSRP